MAEAPTRVHIVASTVAGGAWTTMRRWVVRLLVGMMVLLGAGLGMAEVAPQAQAPPKPDGIRLLRLGFTDSGNLWFLYLVHFDNGQIGVLARLQDGEGEQEVYFGGLLPDGVCALGPEAFLPWPPPDTETPEEADTETREGPSGQEPGIGRAAG